MPALAKFIIEHPYRVVGTHNAVDIRYVGKPMNYGWPLYHEVEFTGRNANYDQKNAQLNYMVDNYGLYKQCW